MRLCLLPKSLQRWLRERRELKGLPHLSDAFVQMLVRHGRELRTAEYRERARRAEEMEDWQEW